MVQQGERKMLNEFLEERFSTNLFWKNPRLGQVSNREDGKLFSVLMSFPDAIVLRNGRVLIIEAKLLPNTSAIGQLLGYRDLIPVTPRFSSISNQPVDLMLVATRDDINVRALAEKEGIEFVVFRPSFIDELEKKLFRLG